MKRDDSWRKIVLFHFTTGAVLERTARLNYAYEKRTLWAITYDYVYSLLVSNCAVNTRARLPFSVSSTLDIVMPVTRSLTGIGGIRSG